MKMHNGLFLFVAIFLVFGVVLWANPPGSGTDANQAVAASSSKPASPAKPAETAKPSDAAKPATTAATPAPAAAVAAAAPIDTSVTGANGEIDYEKGRWHPIHFKPAIESATDEQCLACHKEVLEPSVRPVSPAGVQANVVLGWYQTLDTYAGEQDTFHRRHITSPMAKELMNLKCNFCHQGNAPRDEAPVPPTKEDAGFTLRKMVNPEKTCLLCHGRFPNENMEGLNGPWTEERANYETEDGTNGCLACHNKEGGFRSVRHQVTYLHADNIEKMAEGKADTCYGCHGGRSWYRISYPYPRHPWPDMATDVPAWAKDRPAESDSRYAIKAK